MTVNKTFALAFAFAGFTVSGHAADLDAGSMKDPIPDSLTWNGVTLCGTIDVDYTHQDHGVPPGAPFPQTL